MLFGCQLLAVALVALAVEVLPHLDLGARRSSIPASPARARHLHREGLLGLPLAARSVVAEALGGDQPSYLLREGSGGPIAANPAQRLSARFTRSGVSVGVGGSRVGLGPPAVGYGSSLTPFTAVAPQAHGNRVLYAYPGLDEWYANGPLGIEQGFTLARAPAAAAEGPLTLSMALSGDTTAHLDPSGREVLLTRSGRDLLRYGELTATDARGHALYSWLSAAGGHLLLHVDAAGARYPVRIDPLVQAGELTASGGTAEDGLGGAVAASGHTIVAGAPGRGLNDGAVYVFEELGTGWRQTAMVTPSPLSEEAFGASVAISGNTLVVGAPLDISEQGAAYVFERSGSAWTQVAELTAADGSAGRDLLGSSVAISGSTVVAGAPLHKVGSTRYQGAVYVFEKPALGWANGNQTAELTVHGGAEAEELGYSLAMSENTIAAGAPNYRETPHDLKGAVYVFEKPGSTWTDATQTAELTAADGALDDAFGASIGISGNTIAAGAPFHKDGAGSAHGAVYMFEKPGPKWANETEQAELTPSDGDETHSFGYSLALSGGSLVVGSNASLGAGRLYLFEQSGPKWASTEQPLAYPTAGGSGADIGWSVAIAEGTILSGEPLSNGRRGAVFLFGGEASKPSVVTGPPSTVGQTSATMTGTVNPEGATVGSCMFQYGTTMSYGSSAQCSVPPGSGTSPVAVSASPSGLTAATTYHYRIVATNSHGTAEGADTTFTTEAATTTSTGPSTTSGGGASPGIASTPQAIEEVRLGCSNSQLLLNDLLVQGGHVALRRSFKMEGCGVGS